MTAHDHANLVVLEEFVNNVRPVRHNVILLLHVSHLICLHTLNLIRGGRVAPQDVHAHLLHSVCDAAQGDTKWPLNLVDVF